MCSGNSSCVVMLYVIYIAKFEVVMVYRSCLTPQFLIIVVEAMASGSSCILYVLIYICHISYDCIWG